MTGKLDYVRSSRLRFAGRYTYDNAANQRPDPVQVFTFRDDSHYHFLHTETQFIQSPSSVHTFRAGFSRVWNGRSIQPASIPPRCRSFLASPWGTLAHRWLQLIWAVLRDHIGLMPRRFVSNDFQSTIPFTHVRGRHSFRAGGSLDRIQFNQRSDAASRAPTFSAPWWISVRRGHERRILAPGSDTIRGWRQSIFSGFAQEEFRARRGSVSRGAALRSLLHPG